MERFTIGQMAEVNHVTKKTLMIYHKHGLLVPEEVDPQTGYRYYTLEQCSTLDMIQQLKQVGLSLSQIKDVMDKQDVAYMQSLIREQVARMRREMTELDLALVHRRAKVALGQHDRMRLKTHECLPVLVRKRLAAVQYQHAHIRITPSACARSMRPFINARQVNSPGLAIRAPARMSR